MELLLLCLPYLLLGFVFSIIFSLQVLFSKHKSLFSGASLPPGTYGWPVIGESLEFVSAGWKGHPQRFIHDRMNKFSRECFKTSILGEPVAVMCRAAGNKFLFSNEGKLVTGWWPDSVKKIFPARSDKKEDVKRMRKLIPQFLKPEALKSYIGIMDTIAQGHFASAWENKEEVAVFPLAKQYTFWLACRLFMSIEDPIHIAKLADRFNMLTSGVMTLPIDLPGTPFNRAIKASNIIRKQLRKIIKQRRIDLAEAIAATPTHDILAHMVTTTDREGCHMNDFDIADKILGLLIGGHDTTSVTITSIVRYLAELPHVYDMVYKEQMEITRSKDPRELLKWDDVQKMKYSWNVACEAMRLMPPLQGTFREAIHDFTYAGFLVPKGWKLYWSVYSTHMDHEYFPDPEKFDPTRFEGDGPAPHTYVPFGGGPRMCPGKEYARLEILVFMHNIVRRFKWEKALPKEKIIADPMPIPENGLPVRLVPHHL